MILAIKEAFRYPRNFKLVVVGQTVSVLGTLMVGMALSLYVLHVTGSSLKFSLMLSLQVVVSMVFGPAIGEYVDSVHKKPMLVGLDGIRGMLSISLFVLLLLGWHLRLYEIYGLVLFYSGCGAFFDPAMTSLFPKTVEGDQLAKANIVSSMLGDMSYALGPLLGVVAYGSVGISVVFLVDGLTYLFGAVLSSQMKVEEVDVRSKAIKNFLGSHLRGMQLIFSDKRIRYLVVNEILNHVFLFPFLSVFIPFLIIHVLHGPNYAYGLVGFIATLGSISSAAVSGNWERRFAVERNVSLAFFCLVGFSVFLVPFLFEPTYQFFIKSAGISIALYWGGANFELYLFFAVYFAFYTTLYQSSFPKDEIGRFFANQTTVQAAGRLLGLFLYGFLLKTFQPEVCVAVLIVALLANGVVHSLFVRSWRTGVSRGVQQV